MIINLIKYIFIIIISIFFHELSHVITLIMFKVSVFEYRGLFLSYNFKHKRFYRNNKKGKSIHIIPIIQNISNEKSCKNLERKYVISLLSGPISNILMILFFLCTKNINDNIKNIAIIINLIIIGISFKSDENGVGDIQASYKIYKDELFYISYLIEFSIISFDIDQSSQHNFLIKKGEYLLKEKSILDDKNMLEIDKLIEELKQMSIAERKKMKVIEVNNLRKRYGDFLLNNISFTADEGKIVGFIGVNGSGKTTTIRLLLHLIEDDGGEIKIFGLNIGKNEKEIKNKIGVVMDEGYFYSKITIEEMKKIISPAYSKWNDAVFYSYLNKFNLKKKQKIETLSKGMKMKLSLAFALSHDADLLIMDEPSSGLDPMIRSELNKILKDYVRGKNKTVFMSTHIISDLDKIADDIIFINRGNLVFQKSKEELLDENKNFINIEDIMMSYLEDKRDVCFS